MKVRLIAILVTLLAGSLVLNAKTRVSEYTDYDDSNDSRTIIINDKIVKIVVNAKCDVVYTQSNKNVVMLYGDDMFRKSGIKVNNNTLQVTEGANLMERVEIYAPDAGIFILNGMGDLNCTSYSGDALRVTVNGMYDVHFGDIDVKEFNLTINGSSDFDCRNLTTQKANVSFNGMGSAKIRHTKADVIDASGNGMGDLTLDDISTDRLKVGVSGQASVKISGTAVNTTFTLSGMADIKTNGFKTKYIKKIDSRPDWM